MAPRPRTSGFMGVTLDGFIARRNHTVDYLDRFQTGDEHGYADFFATVDALVIGRRTHDFVAKLAQTEVGWAYPGKQVMVLTHRPLKPVADEFAFAGDPSAVLAELQKRGVKHVYVDGGEVVRDFIQARLLDSLTVSIVPVLLGEGIPLFGGVNLETGLTLEVARPLKNGLAQLSYRLAVADG